MLKKILLLLLMLGTAFAAQGTQDSQKLLSASDAIRNPTATFSLTATLLEYRQGKQVDGNSLLIYSKPDPSSGQYRTLVRFAAPARDAGKLILKNGNELWFYDPTNLASIRISPDQRLLGQAANGDVATVNLALDYTTELKGEEEVPDGDRVPRKTYKLALSAKHAGVTYHHIELWVEVTNSRPVKAKFYSESDRLLKTAYYRRYRLELGVERPTEIVIIDGLDPKWVTIMRFDNYVLRAVPDSWLQRDYLPRFKPE